MIRRWGRQLLFGSTALFAVAGIAVAVAPTVELAVAFRLVQGLGGAAGVVLSRAVSSIGPAVIARSRCSRS